MALSCTAVPTFTLCADEAMKANGGGGGGAAADCTSSGNDQRAWPAAPIAVTSTEKLPTSDGVTVALRPSGATTIIKEGSLAAQLAPIDPLAMTASVIGL